MTYRLIHGDCIEVMRNAKPESIDAIVTDPPYGLTFMGKDWDHFGTPLGFQEWNQAWAEAAMHVLKPGGHLIAFGGTRMYHRLASGVEDAGFEIRDCIMWMYGSGFPKSHNVGNSIRKELCRSFGNAKPVELLSRPFRHASPEARTDSVLALARTLPEGDQVIVMATGEAVDSSVPTAMCLSEIPASIDLSIEWSWSDILDAALIEASTFTTVMESSTTTASKTSNCSTFATTLDFIIQAETSLGGLQFYAQDVGSGSSDSNPSFGIIRTLTATELATWQRSVELDGHGSALKPAYEPIIVARKPLRITGDKGRQKKATVAQNVLAHGTGAYNIDGCRIEAGDEVIERGDFIRNETPDTHEGYKRPGSSSFTDKPKERSGPANSAGRWPANVILDEHAGAMLDDQTGDLGKSAGGFKSGSTGAKDAGIYGAMTGAPDIGTKPGFGDSGGASRFFYTPKTSRKEREAGLDEFEHGERGKPNQGMQNMDGGRDRKRRNNHPTVKPIDLMRYLCRLVTPPNGVILDPFMGSGSTGIAALLEGFKFVGIEKEEEYVDIARARIEHWSKEAVTA